jgi:hypothetical protein
MKETAWWMLVILGSAALVYDVRWYAGLSPHSMRLRAYACPCRSASNTHPI